VITVQSVKMTLTDEMAELKKIETLEVDCKN
jgi:hypothetical protein